MLGIFGREGVDLATYWPLQSNESYAYGAFAAFRNYDGAGGHFGDTSVRATTTDTTSSSVYAAIDAANHNRVVIVAINKATTAKTTAVKVAGEQVFGHAKTYTLTSASPTPQAGATLTSAAQNAFLYTMPAQSVTVIVPST